MRDMRFADVARRGLEPDLAVGRLAPALPVTVLFLLQQFNRRGRDSFVDVATGETGAVFAVPVPFRDHGAATAGAVSGQDKVHQGTPPTFLYAVRCPSTASGVS